MLKIANCLRPSRFGDTVASLPFLRYLDKKYPNSYKSVSIDPMCHQIAPFLLNHPFIDNIHILGKPDQITNGDIDFFSKFSLVYHPYIPTTNQFWYNNWSLHEELFRMNLEISSGRINPDEYSTLTEEEKSPRLEQWFPIERKGNTIAIFPFSGYANQDATTDQRSPSIYWWRGLIMKHLLPSGYKIIQYGHPKSFNLQVYFPEIVSRLNLSLFEMIRDSLGCDLAITTDSGAGHILSAYGMRHIVLYTNWRENHKSNLTALLPINYKKNLTNLFCKGNINNTSHEEVMNAIKKFE